jgi:hypothetical protein
MAEQQRVTFQFGRDTEIHYLDRLPSIGDRVSHGQDLWVVAGVNGDELGGVLVICERTAGGASGGLSSGNGHGNRVESLR